MRNVSPAVRSMRTQLTPSVTAGRPGPCDRDGAIPLRVRPQPFFVT
jgi:hypothetical protein